MEVDLDRVVEHRYQEGELALSCSSQNLRAHFRQRWIGCGNKTGGDLCVPTLSDNATKSANMPELVIEPSTRSGGLRPRGPPSPSLAGPRDPRSAPAGAPVARLARYAASSNEYRVLVSSRIMI